MKKATPPHVQKNRSEVMHFLHTKYFKNQQEMASSLQTSKSLLSQMLSGKKNIGNEAALAYEKRLEPLIGPCEGLFDGQDPELLEILKSGDRTVSVKAIPAAQGEMPSPLRRIDVSQEWMKSMFSVAPDQVAVLIQPTTSMEPTIQKNDIIFVDIKIKAVLDDGLYLIDKGNGYPVVKRIQAMTDFAIKIISDNQLYEPERIASTELSRVKVLGRFLGVWRAHIF